MLFPDSDATIRKNLVPIYDVLLNVLPEQTRLHLAMTWRTEGTPMCERMCQIRDAVDQADLLHLWAM